MEEKLTRLYNTMLLVETKGESTKTMSDCIRYVEQLIKEQRENKVASNTTDSKED